MFGISEVVSHLNMQLNRIHFHCFVHPIEIRNAKSVFANLLFTMFLFVSPLAVHLQPSRRVISLRRDRTSLPGYNALRVTPAFLIYFFTDLIVTCTRAKGGSPGRLGLSPHCQRAFVLLLFAHFHVLHTLNTLESCSVQACSSLIFMAHIIFAPWTESGVSASLSFDD